jgi:hypothetical protein
VSLPTHAAEGARDEVDFHELPTVDPAACHCNRLDASAIRLQRAPNTGYDDISTHQVGVLGELFPPRSNPGAYGYPMCAAA